MMKKRIIVFLVFVILGAKAFTQARIAWENPPGTWIDMPDGSWISYLQLDDLDGYTERLDMEARIYGMAPITLDGVYLPQSDYDYLYRVIPIGKIIAAHRENGVVSYYVMVKGGLVHIGSYIPTLTYPNR